MLNRKYLVLSVKLKLNVEDKKCKVAQKKYEDIIFCVQYFTPHQCTQSCVHAVYTEMSYYSKASVLALISSHSSGMALYEFCGKEKV